MDMQIVIEDTYQQLSETAANIYIEQVKRNPSSVMCSPVGQTSAGMYERICWYKHHEASDFSRLHVFNMDEYVGLDENNRHSLNYSLNQSLYNPLKIKEEQIHRLQLIDPTETESLKQYDEAIASTGGFDLLMLGIGSDGHIAFNMPAATFETETHIQQLSNQTIKDNTRFFDAEEMVPHMAVTIGMRAVLTAKKVVLLVSGKHKAEAYNLLMRNGVVDPRVPASILWLHPDVTVLVERDVLSV